MKADKLIQEIFYLAKKHGWSFNTKRGANHLLLSLDKGTEKTTSIMPCHKAKDLMEGVKFKIIRDLKIKGLLKI